MRNAYKQYVEPILSLLSPDACMELAYDRTFTEYLEIMRGPLFRFCGKNKQSVITSYAYWSIVELYSRTAFFNTTKQGDLQNFIVNFPRGGVDQAKQAYNNIADLTVSFDAKSRFKDMKTLVRNASLTKVRKR